MIRTAGSRSLLQGVVASVLLATGQVHAEDCKPGVADIRDPGSLLRFQVEIADTPDERSRGLMERRSMPRYSGMLFVYPDEEPVAFWMRNTLIPLDMLFFDGTGTLVHVHENAEPLDETPIPGGQAIRYVLELNGGLSETLGIEPGAELRSAALDATTAVWPCDQFKNGSD